MTTDLRPQFRDRLYQALATDARVARTAIGALPFWQVIRVANEIASLYPSLSPADVADALNTIRTAPRGAAA